MSFSQKFNFTNPKFQIQRSHIFNFFRYFRCKIFLSFSGFCRCDFRSNFFRANFFWKKKWQFSKMRFLVMFFVRNWHWKEPSINRLIMFVHVQFLISRIFRIKWRDQFKILFFKIPKIFQKPKMHYYPILSHEPTENSQSFKKTRSRDSCVICHFHRNWQFRRKKIYRKNFHQKILQRRPR